MKKEKSKILKLKKKLNRMEWLEKHSDKFVPLLMGIFMLSGIGFAFAWIFKIFPMFITCTSLMFVSLSSLLGSIAFSAMYNQNKCELIEKIEELEISNAKEKEVLNEYIKHEKIEKEVRAKRSLIKELINNKNIYDKNIIKLMIKSKKAQAEKEVYEYLQKLGKEDQSQMAKEASEVGHNKKELTEKQQEIENSLN